MTTLAKDKPRIYEDGTEDHNDLPVIASDIIFEGAAAGQSAGNIRPLVAGDSFKGFCMSKADNSGGGAGAITARLKSRGKIVLNVTGVSAVTNHGATVYASDDDTFTLSSTGNTAIGKLFRWISGTKCVVAFEDVALRSI